jgi:hypothetical protein
MVYPPNDQRGVSRTQGPGADVGACEGGAVPPPPSIPPILECDAAGCFSSCPRKVHFIVAISANTNKAGLFTSRTVLLI